MDINSLQHKRYANIFGLGDVAALPTAKTGAAIRKQVSAEFNYKNEFTPDPKLKQMLVFKSYKEHWRLWLLKKYMLPYLYWNKMLKGEDV